MSVQVEDELLYNYNQVTGSRPIRKIYSHNLDFSGFPLLCKVTHRQLNPQLKREISFCAYLHAMTSCLNAWLFRTVTDVNSEDRYSDESDAMSLIPQEMLIPQPIAEYLAMVNTVVTPFGDTVKVNVPDAALPQHSIDGMPPGNFGKVTAANHNAYECYVSPLVTRNFIIASRDARPDYDPLPVGSFPDGAIPNRNLLGYYPSEALTPKGRAVLMDYHFPDSDNMAGRLQIVAALFQDVSNMLSRCSREFKIIRFHDIQRKQVQTSLVYARAISVAGNSNTAELARVVSSVHSPYAFNKFTASQAILFSLRRERTIHGRGVCYTGANNELLAGWDATMNHNFTMSGKFAPETGVDGPQLRADLHLSFPPDEIKENLMFDWLKAFRMQKM